MVRVQTVGSGECCRWGYWQPWNPLAAGPAQITMPRAVVVVYELLTTTSTSEAVVAARQGCPKVLCFCSRNIPCTVRCVPGVFFIPHACAHYTWFPASPRRLGLAERTHLRSVSVQTANPFVIHKLSGDRAGRTPGKRQEVN